MKNHELKVDRFKVVPGQKVVLHQLDTASHEGFKDKKEAERQLIQDIELLSQLQYQLYAENKQALLIVFQAMDAAGKDGAIRHVFSGVNPQGCEVHSFKQPSINELGHDYFWRHYIKLPERGKIGIFNRSHYENVLITKIHPEFLMAENLPGIHSVNDANTEFWEERFLDRIENRGKNWKFSVADLKERTFWNEYQKAYETAITKTSTDYAPWYIIPADNKWFSHVAIGNIIVHTLKKMKIQMPEVSDDEEKALKLAEQELLKE